MPDHDGFLTQAQLDAMLRDAVLTHLARLDRVAAAERTAAHFNRAEAERADRRAAWTYRLLAAKGARAEIDADDRAQILASGLEPSDIPAIEAHLAMLQNNGLVPTKTHILNNLLAAQGAPTTAMNIAQTQQIYFRALALALDQTGRRHSVGGEGDADFVAQMLSASVAARVAAVTPVPAPTEPPRAAPAPAMASPYAAAQPLAPIHAPLPEQPQECEDPVEDGVVAIGAELARRRTSERSWDEKTRNQSVRLCALFERFLLEDCRVRGLRALRQHHLAMFVTFLREDIYRHYGKAAGDHELSIAEMRRIGAAKPRDLRGVQGPTLNRHLTFLKQLFDFAAGQGVRMSPELSTKNLRPSAKSITRARAARPALKSDAASSMFKASVFTGCKSSQEPHHAGDHVFHRALYYAPMLLYQTGGRRDEICGLAVADVIADGEIPYISIRENAIRRIKNLQSRRDVPLHPELIRLGFLDYVAAIGKLGYVELFPDLRSPGMKSFGDRFYREFQRILVAADEKDVGLVIHSLRHGFGNTLKQCGVTEEERADLLGHAGSSETSERYCEAYDIKHLHDLILKIPNVTAHLEPRAVTLLPRVEGGGVRPGTGKPIVASPAAPAAPQRPVLRRKKRITRKRREPATAEA